MTGSASRPPAPQYGPAPRSMDRFSASVDGGGVLTLDTGKITLGPLPVARRPAGPHPAAYADRLHLMADETPATPAPAPDGTPGPAAAGGTAEEQRLPATVSAGEPHRPTASPPRRRSAPPPG